MNFLLTQSLAIKSPKIKKIDNKIIKVIKKNWYLSVITESLKPPLVHKVNKFKVMADVIHRGICI